MTKTDPALGTVRKVRREISREFDKDPVRLIEHYLDMQRRIPQSRLVKGPEGRDATMAGRDAAELGR